jgi:ParB-like nuclease domain
MPVLEWPAEKLEPRPIVSLIPYARNARTHSPEQIGQLKGSMIEFGWTMPVLVDEAGILIAGHGRLLAAAELVEGGHEKFATAPTMIARGWSKAQIQAYRIADNRLALSASWDQDMLRVEMEELDEEGFDLALTGFDELELEALLASDPETGDADQEWRNVPEYEHEDQLAKQRIVVNFASFEHVQEFAALIGQALTPHTRSIWFPPAEIGRYADKAYIAEQSDAA